MFIIRSPKNSIGNYLGPIAYGLLSEIYCIAHQWFQYLPQPAATYKRPLNELVTNPLKALKNLINKVTAPLRVRGCFFGVLLVSTWRFPGLGGGVGGGGG